MSKKKATLYLSHNSIDSAIDKLKKLKKEGFVSIEGISCDCWHECFGDDGCCFIGCCCGAFEVSQ